LFAREAVNRIMRRYGCLADDGDGMKQGVSFEAVGICVPTIGKDIRSGDVLATSMLARCVSLREKAALPCTAICADAWRQRSRSTAVGGWPAKYLTCAFAIAPPKRQASNVFAFSFFRAHDVSRKEVLGWDRNQ
jgi:hypothetical protein